MISPSSVISDLLGPNVVGYEVRSKGYIPPVFSQEEEMIRNSCVSRREHFSLGRACARSALSCFGYTSFPVIADKKRAPIWPSDLVGSISHADGYCAVALARKDHYLGLGIDVETIGKLDIEAWPLVFTQAEIETLNALCMPCKSAMATIMFSAKEAFYKCQYQVTKSWVGFKDVELEVTDNEFLVKGVDGYKTSHLVNTSPVGRFRLIDEYAFTAISV